MTGIKNFLRSRYRAAWTGPQLDATDKYDTTVNARVGKVKGRRKRCTEASLTRSIHV